MALRRTRDRVRRSACAAVLAGGAVLLAACGGAASGAEDEAAGPGAVSPAAATDEAPATTPSADAGELGDRLLPAEAFGPDASVRRLDGEDSGEDSGGDWHGGWGWGGWRDGDTDGTDAGSWLDQVTVEPAACADALQALPVPADDPTDPTVAAEAAHTDAVHSVEVLAEAPQLAGLALPVDELAAACSSVTVTGPQGWSATVQLAALQVPAVGEDSGALQVTVDGWGQERTALVGVAVDGSRGLLLAQTGEPGEAAPDAAAFATLFGKAGAVAFG